jgi:hypothetical protein
MIPQKISHLGAFAINNFAVSIVVMKHAMASDVKNNTNSLFFTSIYF